MTTKSRSSWRIVATSLLLGATIFTKACSQETSSKNAVVEPEVITISIGTQDQVINTAIGGATVREKKLLSKHLPQTGKYENVEYQIEWSSYTSGPPITTKMIAGEVDIGLMGDFPAAINLITFQEQGEDLESIYIGTLAYSPNGAGNAVLVPKNSRVKSLVDLQGKIISVPFGSAAHGMLLKALKDANIDPQKDVTLISQSPEVGGTSLRTNQIDAHADFVPFGELFPFRGFAKKIFDGAQTGVPTLHGIVVRSDFAQKHPSLVIAYLKAVLEANQMFRANPEVISAQIERWTGVEKEVVYMFLGPSGLQAIDPTIGPGQLAALKSSITTLTELGRISQMVNPEDVKEWVDESYLLQAIAQMNLNYNELVAAGEKYAIAGNDALTKEAIDNPKMAAQLWVQGEDKVRNFASIPNMLKMLSQLRKEGQVANAIFVHDRSNGWKLFAENSYFVRSGKEISAFLLESDAKKFAAAVGGKVTDLGGIQ